MAKGRIHFRVKGDGPMAMVLCGWMGSRHTTDESAVTCSLCRDKLQESSRPQVVLPSGEYKPRMGCREAAVLSDELPEHKWPTWRSAVRAYVTAVDDGWASRSSSDPSRFEAHPGGASGPPEGDMAQRLAARLAFVGRALARAYVDEWVVTTYPVRKTLTSIQCRDILVGRVVGKAVRSNTHDGYGGTRAKSWIVRRVEWDDASIGEAFGVSVGVVLAVVRDGGSKIEAELTTNGQVLLADVGLREGVAMAGELVPWDLHGWEQISDALGVDVNTARKFRDEKGMPVEKYAGKWRAESARLREWLIKQRGL